jgi:hypothetical protein
MARGSSYGDDTPMPPISATPQVPIIRRATRDLQPVHNEEENENQLVPVRQTGALTSTYFYEEEHPLARHRTWITRLLICMVLVVLGAFVLVSVAMYQRSGDSQLVSDPNMQSFSIQVGGSLDAFNTWQNSDGPIAGKKPVPTHIGPYAVLGKPTINADFINQVLASYHSPAAGKGQALFDLGVKYGIDPVFALAFFMHESLFGTTGVARDTLSLGNLRCIKTRPCIDQNIGGFAQMYSWEDGFEQWYKLVRNLYVAQWGLVTVDQIIPTYAPSSDHNNVAGYIAALKLEIDSWHAGILRP